MLNQIGNYMCKHFIYRSLTIIERTAHVQPDDPALPLSLTLSSFTIFDLLLPTDLRSLSSDLRSSLSISSTFFKQVIDLFSLLYLFFWFNERTAYVKSYDSALPTQ